MLACPIATVEEFYAHALAIEREAANRYAEFAAWYAERGEETLAGLCRNLASVEREHFHHVLRLSEGLALPAIAEEAYHWLEKGMPEAAVRELFYRVAHPNQLLQIALRGEVRARGFFVWVARTSRSRAVRELASIMAAEEAQHVQWVREALEYRPEEIDWDKLFANGNGQDTAAPR